MNQFENLFFKIINQININDQGYFIKSPTPIKLIYKNNKQIPIFFEKALCDFLGIYQGKFILIELKTISNNYFVKERLTNSQINQLQKVAFFQGISIVGFWIKNEDIIVLLPINKLLNCFLATKNKRVTIYSLINEGEILKNDLLPILNFLINHN